MIHSEVVSSPAIAMVIPNVVARHLEEACSLLEQHVGLPRSTELRLAFVAALESRLVSHLDALSIAAEHAIRLGLGGVQVDPASASIIAFLQAGSESNRAEASEQAVSILQSDCPEIRNAARMGLRLASCEHIALHLQALLGKRPWDFYSAAALDVLAFHRLPVHAELGAPPDEEGDEIAWLLAEAGGRMPGAWKETHLKQFLSHASPRVREAALRASARSGLRELLHYCREAVAKATPLEAIEFLGVVGSGEDLSRLQRAASSPVTAKAALVGLGRLGLPGAIPFLLEHVGHPELAESAAAAIKRITGQDVPRGPAPEPPAGLSEDELDLWEPRAPVDATGARDWWKTNSARFDPTKRYQAGLNVSDAPLGPVFDELPLAFRYDVYLRERALTPGTPDWELETWSWQQRNPGAPRSQVPVNRPR